MEFFIDVAYDSINKYGEELCGDKVEVFNTDQSIIIVLADGLGSGVKANILATMTAKIVGTMLKEGTSIYDTVDTITNTLPVCNVRKLAYSTFSILKIRRDGSTYLVEYDNPPIFFTRNNEIMDIDRKELRINGKIIKESNITLKEGDTLTLVSDGVIHAGIGEILNLGWQWENVADYLRRQVRKEKCAKGITRSLIDTCKCLYLDKPGDDTTVVTVKMRKPEVIDLFTGPPEEQSNDSKVIKEFMKNRSKKVVCGGTAAKIVGRELSQDVIVDLESMTKEVPPMAKIKGIDLVTEGVLTLSKTVEKLRRYTDYLEGGHAVHDLNSKDGASKLARMLIEDCTHLNLWVGKAINPAYRNPSMPIDLSIKLEVVNELSKLMKGLGKKVSLNYV